MSLSSETEPGDQDAGCARPGRSAITENQLLPHRTEPRQARNSSLGARIQIDHNIIAATFGNDLPELEAAVATELSRSDR